MKKVKLITSLAAQMRGMPYYFLFMDYILIIL
jgi:hypothetical protein